MNEETRMNEEIEMNEEIKMDEEKRETLLSKKMVLSSNGRTILEKRYLRKNQTGELIETVEEAVLRIAETMGSVQNDEKAKKQATKGFYDLIIEKRFFPNTPTWTGAGTPLGQLAACFVLPISDDLGKESEGIMATLLNASLIQQTGGGNGFSFSRLRQKGAYIASSGGTSTGPIGFLKVYDCAFGMVAQGGTRRGANMAVLRVDHPDIREFIRCKTSETSITNFNISVGITDAFMDAVKNNEGYDLIAPHTGKVVERVRAREIFDEIVKHAHANGEPGVLFLDTANRANPVPHLYTLESTNPCGEQWLGPYENCCLGSINLAEHINNLGIYGKTINWGALRKTVEESVRFLDSVVTANKYVPQVPQLREAAFRCRRIGLGIMGLADVMAICGIRYGSVRGQEFASQIMEFIRFHAMFESSRLAKELGSFTGIKGSIFDPENFKWQIPTPMKGVIHSTGFGRRDPDWQELKEHIITYGIRNAAITTVAPTGTIATVAGCKGYGCEPFFALAYVRHVNEKEGVFDLQEVNPYFEEALKEKGYSTQVVDSIIKRVLDTGTCQDIEELDQKIKDSFVVTQDITPTEHVRMQGALQAFVDNSMSKTCNLPRGSIPEDVEKCYMEAWNLGCKGITVYIAGSRDVVVVETAQDRRIKEEKLKPSTFPVPEPVNTQISEQIDRELSDGKHDNNQKVSYDADSFPVRKGLTNASIDTKSANTKKEQSQQAFTSEGKRVRPKILKGKTIKITTPVGDVYTTLNNDPNGKPFELFVATSKAGSETSAISEAFGRLISYNLRLESRVPEETRLRHITKQLCGIGGKRSVGWGPNRICSLPDGISKSIAQLLPSENTMKDGIIQRSSNFSNLEHSLDSLEPVLKSRILVGEEIGDICPDCGYSTFINSEGCKRCFSCSYTECT